MIETDIPIQTPTPPDDALRARLEEMERHTLKQSILGKEREIQELHRKLSDAQLITLKEREELARRRRLDCEAMLYLQLARICKERDEPICLDGSAIEDLLDRYNAIGKDQS